MITRLSDITNSRISTRRDRLSLPAGAMERVGLGDDSDEFSRFKFDAIEFDWLEHEVRNCKLLIHKDLSGIIVLDDGTALLEQFSNSGDDYIKHHMVKLYADAVENGELPDRGSLDEVLVAFDKESFNHYHLNVISLPRIATYLSRYRNDIEVVLPDLSIYRGEDDDGSYLDTLLKQSSIDKAQVRKLKPGIYNVQCARLIKPMVDPITCVHSEAFAEYFSTMNAEQPSINGRDCFLSRQGARNARSQDSSEPIALKKSKEEFPEIEVIVAHDLSMQEQMDVVRSANSLHALHGAALTNMIFSGNKELIIQEYNQSSPELTPFRPHFFHLALANGFQYRCSKVEQ